MNTNTLYISEAFREGIKTVGIGKKGSKSMPIELTHRIGSELKNSKPDQAALGAFFGALYVKGISEEESTLSEYIPEADILNSPKELVSWLDAQAPDEIKTFCEKLLSQKTLTQKQTEALGDFLFSDYPNAALKGLAASILRVRYETPEEYEGLLKSAQKTFRSDFQNPPPKGFPIIQIAEPFDGVDHSNLITPLISQFLQKQDYRVVSLCGRNSGPKFGNNLYDIARALDGTFITNNSQIKDTTNSFGYFLDQKDLSNAMDAWVDIRHRIIKRPFLATIERFVNPAQADIMIGSAFHPPYGVKMIEICERQGFSKIIIIRNGLEGTIAFPLMRNAKVLYSYKQKNGSYKREEFEYDAQKELNITVDLEERFDNPSLDKNVDLIKEFMRKGYTDYNLFNWRVEATCKGIARALKHMETDA